MAPERTQRLTRISMILGTLLLCAMLTARGFTQLVAATVLPVVNAKADSSVTKRLASVTPTPRVRAVELGRAVLERNMFDSQTGSMPWDEPAAVVEETPAEEGEEPDPTGEPAFCTGSLKLIATMVSPRAPEASFASIQAGGKTLLYRSGMQVDGHDLVGIREHRIFLRPSGRPLCQLAMFSPDAPSTTAAAQPSPPPATPPKATPRRSNSGISEQDLNQGISRVSDTSYTVSRGLLDRVLASQSEMMRAARIIPYEENGRTVGVKVYGIRRNALLGKLGIQNGDVLRTINGYDLSSPDTALEAYTKLRQADQFSIAMIRRGQAQTMEYTVK